MKSLNSLQIALSLLGFELKREKETNAHIKKLYSKFFPLELDKALRSDFCQVSNINIEDIIQYYIDQGHKEIDLKQEVQGIHWKAPKNNIENEAPLLRGAADNEAQESNLSIKNDTSKLLNENPIEENLELNSSTLSDQTNKKRHFTQLKNLVATLLFSIEKNTQSIENKPLELLKLDEKILESYSNISASLHGPLLHFGTHDLISKSLDEYGEWAQIELNFLNSFIRDGDVVIDGGSYIGTHARSFSIMVGKKGEVHCFEPNKYAFKKLYLNSFISQFNNLKIYPSGLGEKNQELTLFSESKDNLGGTSFHYREDSQDITQIAHIIPLDIYIDKFQKINFIKLDVEGMELQALLGANKLIRKFHPIIYCEFNSLTKAVEIYEWSKSNNYRAWGCIHDAYNLDNYNANKNDFFEGGKECGLLLLFDDGKNDKPPATPGTITKAVESLDDIGLILAKKPQYSHQTWE